jgi:hypothetical protein
LEASSTYQSSFLQKYLPNQRDDGIQFKFVGRKISLFVSSTPCGDACLDILSEDPNKAEPWRRPEGAEVPSNLHGHEYIWERGKVRFKPGNRPLVRIPYHT